MAKILTREDRIKQQYTALNNLNQRLKNISTCYYIHHDGTIYVKALVNFTEVLVKLRYPEKIDLFLGAMILPNKFFEFAKKSKKTKLTIEENDNEFIFGQNDDDELSLTVNIVNKAELGSDKSNEFLQRRVINEMYKRYFELESDNYIQYQDRDQYTFFNEEEIEGLCSANPLFLDINDTNMTLTKQLFLDIKKDDKIGIARYCYQKIGRRNSRVFYMLKHETDMYDSYTIFNTLQQID